MMAAIPPVPSAIALPIIGEAKPPILPSAITSPIVDPANVGPIDGCSSGTTKISVEAPPVNPQIMRASAR